jgi:hypothetical protein
MYNVSYKKDWRCAYNETLRHVPVTTVLLGKQLVLHILSMCLWLFYPAYDAHAPYYTVICGLAD